jgi:hypothetical protein
MNNPLEQLENTFSVEIPAKNTLDEYLDWIIPRIRQHGEDLSEQKFYVTKGGKPWLEVRDDPGFQESVLHFFNEGGEYLQSVDGNVSRGRWRLLDRTNKIIIELGGGGGGKKKGKGGDDNGEGSDGGGGGGGGQPFRSELYELAFLNPRFMILKKHGDQQRKGRKKYMALGFEGYVRGRTWLDYVKLLHDEYYSHWGAFQWFLLLAIIVIGFIILYTVT